MDNYSIQNLDRLIIIWWRLYFIGQSYILNVLQRGKIIEVKNTGLRLDRLVRADEALYRAKDAGRSCVVADGCVVDPQFESINVELAP